MDQSTLDQRSINTIRFLALDAVQQAKSGHAGAPLGAATVAYTLWDRLLKHNPRNPAWPDRDRFVLSLGHGSMLLYSLLHLTGYDLPLEELRNFRQWDSRTPGHPEHGLTPGVEATTGPLGQGFANGVGMAIAERWLAAQYNRPGHEVVDHYTYVLASDGDMQEGVSSEAASLAGTLKLGKLICLYDDNEVQIEGPTSWVFTEDVGRRFEAYGWQVLGPVDGNDASAVEQAVRAARVETGRPSLVICRTTIGYGSPLQGTAKAHSDPMKDEAVQATRETLGWPQDPQFLVPQDVAAHMRRAVDRGERAEAAWRNRMESYTREHPALAAALQSQLQADLPPGWDEGLSELFPPGTAAMATRAASGKVLNTLAGRVPALIGGSADLGPSTKTLLAETADFGPSDYSGRNLRFGVREHAMGAIAGGMALHGGTIPYTGTFLVFSDYMRPPMRLAALSHARVVFVFTHDSIGVGEDGPTHQPVEHIMSLRAVPNLTVIRPADATETAEAWRTALLNSAAPTVIILTRQDVPVLDRSEYPPAEGLRCGAYVLWQSGEGTPDLILIGTGSEVHIALEAGKRLAADGFALRVVSMPSWELFEQQPPEYREGVLPSSVRRRVAVEAGAAIGWERYVGLDGAIVAMEGFGASAPGRVLFERFGFTSERVLVRARALLHESGKLVWGEGSSPPPGCRTTRALKAPLGTRIESGR